MKYDLLCVLFVRQCYYDVYVCVDSIFRTRTIWKAKYRNAFDVVSQKLYESYGMVRDSQFIWSY